MSEAATAPTIVPGFTSTMLWMRMGEEADESRPQAPPLPLKRGEIGYSDEDARAMGWHAIEDDRPVDVLPDRHPADRDAPPSISDSHITSIPPTRPSNTLVNDSVPPSSPPPGKRCLPFFAANQFPHVFGVRLLTLLLLMFQLTFIAGTIAIWICSLRLVSEARQPPTSSDGNPSMPSSSTSIFLHILFGIALFAQLLVFERRIFCLRAERYAYLHPGEVLPSHRQRHSLAGSVSYAPWNRPPLPTYAATLAASGYLTGDAEDHIIAAPPPPAYGNIRDSTLVLASLSRGNTQRSQRHSAQPSEQAPHLIRDDEEGKRDSEDSQP